MPKIRDNAAQITRLYAFDEFAEKVNRLGFGFALCDADGRLVLNCQADGLDSDESSITKAAVSAVKGLKSRTESPNILFVDNRYLAVALSLDGDASTEETEAGLALVDLGRQQYQKLLVEMISQLLVMLAESFQLAVQTKQQIETVSNELSQVYEELVLLHKLSNNMKVTESDCNYLQMACDSLTEIVPVEGIAILLEKGTTGEKLLVLAAGAGIIDIDPHMAAIMHSRLEEQISKGKEALLDSEIDSPFKYQWSESVRNIIIVPLFGKDKVQPGVTATLPHSHHIIGLMVAVNRKERADFDSIDANLFISVANSCAVFIENGRLFKDLRDLLIGSLKALTNSIDAKDQYTRGHSERVAFISRWIAERAADELNLKEEQIHRIYLAGLLHDIGKMGVDEAVLRKKGRLSDEEYNCIKAHPSIGAGILGDIKQMRDIVPGVLSHHERIDGKGYPGGLSGDEIPLIGKILALADSFDAMTSKRTYRDAMSIEQAMQEIEHELGKQFDEKIGRIFLDSDVYHLWDILQDGLKDVYADEDSSQYGAVAVGTLIR
ncbi:MAG: HD-GYP domain-containing protein [Phycisphaerales bacterium]|jgi:HD-GYP domain-containing protein (c-di-GMP phosphodiesterase class II)